MFTWMRQRFTRWLDTRYSRIDATGQRSISAQTQSGVVITEGTALTIPAFFHGVRLYAQTLGSLCWDLIEESDKGRAIARNHPIHRLIHDEPNEYQLASEWRETMLLNAIVYGNAYAYIQHNGNMRPTAMLPLLSEQTYPVRIGGELVYETMVNGQKQTLGAYEVFHLKGLSANGLTGIPLVRLMAETLGLSKAEEAFASAFFGNGCNMGGYLEHPNKITDPARKHLINSFAEGHAGPGNAHKWTLLEEGMKANRLDIDAEKTQLIQSRQFQIGDLSRILALSPHLLFDLSRATFSNIEHLGIEAVTYSFKPWANKLCQEANRKLLYESEKGRFETCLDLKPLMMGSSLEQAQRDQILFNTASLTPNEIRAKDGKNPIDGGDQLFINIATLPLSLIVQRTLAEIAKAQIVDPEDAEEIEAAETIGVDTSPAPVSDDAPPESNKDVISTGPAVDGDMVEDANALGSRSATVMRPVVASAVARLMRREGKAVASGYAKHSPDKEALDRWYAAYSDDTRKVVVEHLAPVVDVVKSLGGSALGADALADEFIEETRADLRKVEGEDDVVLMTEGWQGERCERFVSRILGETNEHNN
jgi:HK97 family phage portal protein